MQQAQIEAAPLPGINTIGTDAIGAALRGGLRDFRRAPQYGLFFSLIYVLGGWIIWSVYAASGQEWWLIPVIVGFPILAPFAAVGLYEVSRRLEAGERLDWRGVLGVVFSQKDRQVPSMAMVILLLFMFWVFVAHTIFALFMGLSAMTNVTSSLQILSEGNGPVMLLVGTLVGGGFAAVLFSVSVIGLPLILDREVDFITAMIHSVQAVLANIGPMIAWGVTIAALVFIGMAPMFLGLFIVLPVLGHASWHMYRRLVG
jgi:uncharacterized membrane protein